MLGSAAVCIATTDNLLNRSNILVCFFHLYANFISRIDHLLHQHTATERRHAITIWGYCLSVVNSVGNQCVSSSTRMYSHYASNSTVGAQQLSCLLVPPCVYAVGQRSCLFLGQAQTQHQADTQTGPRLHAIRCGEMVMAVHA
jgi:hypothetical protein